MTEKTPPESPISFLEIKQTLIEDQAKLENSDGFQPTAASNIFKLTLIGELKIEPPVWLINDLVETDSLCLLFGEPGAAKSLMALDAACCIASGLSFHGHRTKQGSVIYLAGEGTAGLKRRFKAWTIANKEKLEALPDKVDLKTLPLLVSETPAQLCSFEFTEFVATAIKLVADTYGEPALIIVDTLARNFGPADENSTADMNIFIQSLDRLRGLYGSTILPIHHSGHADKSRARGAMALKASLDFEYRLDKDTDGVIRLKATKTKDAAPPAPMAFKIKSVFLQDDEGRALADDDGQPVCSVVLEPTMYEPDTNPGRQGSGPLQAVAEKAFESLLSEHQDNLNANGLDPDTARVSVETWFIVCSEKGMDRHQFNRIKKAASSIGLKIENGYVERL